MQEALICFWLREQQYPGQHLNWYLRGVRFYLQHLRNSGCSLDSPRHSGARTEFARESGGRNEWLDTLRFDEGIMSEVTAHDLFSELLKWLRPIDQSILLALAEGLGPSEIAETLPISPQSVLRHRKKIADMAIKLGVVRLPVSPNPKARPH